MSLREAVRYLMLLQKQKHDQQPAVKRDHGELTTFDSWFDLDFNNVMKLCYFVSMSDKNI